MREESFAPEFQNYINSIISNKNLDININKLYERILILMKLKIKKN